MLGRDKVTELAEQGGVRCNNWFGGKHADVLILACKRQPYENPAFWTNDCLFTSLPCRQPYPRF